MLSPQELLRAAVHPARAGLAQQQRQCRGVLSGRHYRLQLESNPNRVAEIKSLVYVRWLITSYVCQPELALWTCLPAIKVHLMRCALLSEVRPNLYIYTYAMLWYAVPCCGMLNHVHNCQPSSLLTTRTLTAPSCNFQHCHASQQHVQQTVSSQILELCNTDVMCISVCLMTLQTCDVEPFLKLWDTFVYRLYSCMSSTPTAARSLYSLGLS